MALVRWLALAVLACSAESVQLPNGAPSSNESGGTSGSGSAGGTVAAGMSSVSGTGGSALGAGTAGSVAIEPPPEGTDNELMPRAAVPCESPRPRATGGGYVDCADGSSRRPEAGQCVSHLPYVPDSDTKVGDECLVDADCPSEHDYCKWGLCQKGCIDDSECGVCQVCFCEEPIGRCIDALCSSDADCPDDYPCSGTFGFGWSGFACQSPDDQCFQDSDCGFGRVECTMDTPRVCFVPPG